MKKFALVLVTLCSIVLLAGCNLHGGHIYTGPALVTNLQPADDMMTIRYGWPTSTQQLLAGTFVLGIYNAGGGNVMLGYGVVVDSTDPVWHNYQWLDIVWPEPMPYEATRDTARYYFLALE